jgi:opacity protein-like surface antigen
LKYLYKIFFLALCFCSIESLAQAVVENVHPHAFYAGITGGYGNTTWGQLVPSEENTNAAMRLSTPSKVNEGGGVIGAFFGYELIPLFAVEAAYTRYPNAEVFFDEFSLFTFDHDGRMQFSTRTDVVSMSGKFMLQIPRTPLKAFSSVGVAGTHRNDILTNHWRVSPTFGVGLDYNLTERTLVELGINYTGGYGESELDPVQDYIPFLYSGFLRLAYRF